MRVPGCTLLHRGFRSLRVQLRRIEREPESSEIPESHNRRLAANVREGRNVVVVANVGWRDDGDVARTNPLVQFEVGTLHCSVAFNRDHVRSSDAHRSPLT